MWGSSEIVAGVSVAPSNMETIVVTCRICAMFIFLPEENMNFTFQMEAKSSCLGRVI